jgi:RTX calcium-binding nonapeptide repeat (4 copies)/Putative metal-binding motif
VRNLAKRGACGVAALVAALLFTALSPLAVAPASGQTPGTQQRVSSDYADDPQAAYNAQGDQYLVVWQAQEAAGGNTEIFGRLVNGAGDPVGAEFQISSMGPVGTPQLFSWQAAVAYNAQANEYLVTWVGRDTGDVYEIFGQRLTAAGAETGTDDFRISTMGPDSNFQVLQGSIAYNAQANEYLVAWSGEDNTGGPGPFEHEVYAQRLTAAGAETGTNDVRISSMGPDGNTNFEGTFPAVAYNSQANEYLVTWDGNESAGPNDREYEIYGQRLTAAGAATGADDFRISTMGPDGDNLFDAHDPAVAYNAQANEYLVTWTGVDGAPLADHESEIFGQRLDAGGAATGADDFRVSTAMGADGNACCGAGSPAVAYNPQSNEYLAIWEGVPAGESEIYGQRFTAAGVATGRDDFRISAMGPDGDEDFGASVPAVASGAQANEYLAVWGGDHEAEGVVGVFASHVGPDADGDGSPDAQDCDDANASIRPGASDVPGNGVDEDCSGADTPAPATSPPPPPDPAPPEPGPSGLPGPPGPSGPPLPPLPPLPGTATNGNDTLTGTEAGETMCGLLGSDVVNALGGDDTVFGDLCNARSRALLLLQVQAGAGGDDTLNGGAGNDTMYGAVGKDRLSGAAGADKLFGDAGNDVLSGGAGRDSLDGGAGNDRLTGGAKVNSYKGGSGNDTVNARNGKRERIDCGAGRKDSASVDKADRVRGCEKVKRARK